MQINPINNNQKNANFKAKMQLKGCTNLLKNEQIKSLITIYGKKNVRLKHEGGDEFEIVVK